MFCFVVHLSGETIGLPHDEYNVTAHIFHMIALNRNNFDEIVQLVFIVYMFCSNEQRCQ